MESQGDWKISGFGLSTYLKQPDGQDTKWLFPEYDHRLPDSVQRNFDYLAPEYCLDEHLSTSNDMYSLGCILHSIHTRSGPPFQNHHSLDRIRKNVENLGVLRAAWSRVPDDVQGKDLINTKNLTYPSEILLESK
jgi:SCY1-like protein 2